MKNWRSWVAGVALCGLALVPSQALAISTGLELLLLVDVSGSVDNTEYNLQKTGYVNAFNDPTIQSAIASITGGVAVAYVEWSGSAQQSIEVPWTLLTNATSSSNFATAISNATRNFSGSTAPGSAINFGVSSMNSNTYDGTRRVIDVSGDGAQNDGVNTFTAATNAHNAGITINGLAILGELGLQTWYQNNIVTPGGGFLLVANDFGDFQQAVATKIGREVVGVPEPASVILLGAGLVGLAAWRRRKADNV